MVNRASGTMYLLLSLLFLSFLFYFCGVNTAGGFETTNGLRITVCADSLWGKATPGSQIIFCATSFIAPDLSANSFLDTVYADLNGNFSLYSLPSGRYNLVARSEDFKRGAVISNINIDKLNLFERSESSEYLSLGSISGSVISTIDQSSLIFIEGMAIFDSTNAGIFRLSNIPSGKYKIQAYQKINRDLETDIYYGSQENVVLMESGNETGVDLIMELID